MNKWMVLLGLFIVWTAIWVTIVRPMIRDKPWATPFFEAVEPIERTLWKKSESILWARTLQAVGFLLSFLTWIGELNLTPLLLLLPEEHRAYGEMALPLLPLVINVLGTIDEFLRRDTSEPLEVVAASSHATPEVKAAIATFEDARAEVKAVIAEAKAA